MKTAVLAEARGDLLRAADRYEAESSAKLAARFVAEFERLVRLLARHPTLGTPSAAGLRAFPMKVFPYLVCYRVRAEVLEVVVVRHQRQRPGFGTHR